MESFATAAAVAAHSSRMEFVSAGAIAQARATERPISRAERKVETAQRGPWLPTGAGTAHKRVQQRLQSEDEAAPSAQELALQARVSRVEGAMDGLERCASPPTTNLTPTSSHLDQPSQHAREDAVQLRGLRRAHGGAAASAAAAAPAPAGVTMRRGPP